jgi:hypothetical protein
VIDFRYHLVSLVSVFLALAIGVVLGAGPLQESIGETLTNQVDALRRDKENLQLAVGNREEQIQHRDQFVSAVGDELVAEQLGGRTVAVVALPGAGADAVDALAAQVEAAGASVSGRVTVLPAWVDPAAEASRRSLAEQLVPHVDPRPPADAGVAGELGAVLAWAIATPDVAAAGQVDPAAATVLDGLRGGELVTVDGEPTQRATLVLVATGAPASDGGEGADGDGATTEDDWLPLVRALDVGSSGAVVAGPLAATEQGGLLAAVRGGDLSALVSTVDEADTPMGRVIAVLALREQLTGAAGSYGFGEGAAAVVPETDAAPAQP